MIVPLMAISNLALTQQIYSEETNGAHAHYHEPVPLRYNENCSGKWLTYANEVLQHALLLTLTCAISERT